MASSRFAALQFDTDSDSDNESVQSDVPKVCQDTIKNNQPTHTNVNGNGHMNTNTMGVSMGMSNYMNSNNMSSDDVGEFSAVSKKKAHSGKVSAEMVKKAAEVSNQNMNDLSVTVQLQASPDGYKSPLNNVSPKNTSDQYHHVGSENNVTGILNQNLNQSNTLNLNGNFQTHMNNSNQMNIQNMNSLTQNQVKGIPSKKKKSANNMFACLDDDSGTDDEEDESGKMDVECSTNQHLNQQNIKPILPKQLGFNLNLNQTSAIPEYFAVTHIESTQDDTKPETSRYQFGVKKFKKEVVLFSVLFVNTATKKVDFEFSRVVQPTDFPNLNKTTMELTGLTDEILTDRKAQPLDEVMREFERFLKEQNLVSANRNKKRAATNFTQQENEFLIVTSGPEIINDGLRLELTRKGLTPMNYFKKWIDVKKIFAELYGMGNDETCTLHEVLEKICMEFEGSPHIDDARNIAKVVVCMLNDVPKSLICNQMGK